MTKLEEARAKINAIDEQLVRLFIERLEVSREVAAAKREMGLPITDPARERAILSHVAEEVGPEYENDARLFFSTLFNISKARQRVLLKGDSPLVRTIQAARAATPAHFPTRAVVAVPGVEGAYAQQAASLFFRFPTIRFVDGFERVFEAVEKGDCPYGVLPVENSAAGTVAAVYDLMCKHRFHIVRALRLKVNHVLLAVPGARLEDIKTVSSHPHAIAQCTNFLKSHPAISVVPGTNTARAAKELAASGCKEAAVIASRACAELYGLSVIAEDIGDAAFNYTRFICISKNLEIYPDANKLSLMLTLPHHPGSLNAIISKFASIDVNLSKLESRPIPGMDFEFRFTFDFDATPTDPRVLCLLSELSLDPEIEHFVFLGAYAEN